MCIYMSSNWIEINRCLGIKRVNIEKIKLECMSLCNEELGVN